MLSQAEVLYRLRMVGAILEGHFVLKSGLHSGTYVNKDGITPHTRQVSDIAIDFARAFEHNRVQAVIGPATAGIVLSTWTAHHLDRLFREECPSVWADKEGDGFVIGRGFGALIKGKRVLIVEDILTTGSSVAGVVRAVRAVGGAVVGVAAIVNRGHITAEMLDVPKLHAIAALTIQTFPAAECPLCASDVPINTQVGHGREFLSERAARS